jgi:hypothetical protein
MVLMASPPHGSSEPINPMKPITLLIALLGCVLFQPVAAALPPWKQGPPLHKQIQPTEQENSDSNSLKGRLVLICKDTRGIVLIPVEDRRQAIALLSSGTITHKKDCRTRLRTRVRNPVRRIGAQNKVTELVDSNGEKCLTLGRIK